MFIHRCFLLGVVSIAACSGHSDEVPARVPNGWSHFGMSVDRETSMVSLEMELSSRNRHILTVKSWLHGVGATHVRLTPDHRRVSFQVLASQAERLFAILLSTFQNDNSGAITLGTLDEFKVPASLQPYIARARLSSFPSPHWRAAVPISRQSLLEEDTAPDPSSYELLFWLPPCTIVMLAVAYILHTLRSLGKQFRLPTVAKRKCEPTPCKTLKPVAEVPKKPNSRLAHRKREKVPPAVPRPESVRASVRPPGDLPAKEERKREREDEAEKEEMEGEEKREMETAEIPPPPSPPHREACASQGRQDSSLNVQPTSPSSQPDTASGENQRREMGGASSPSLEPQLPSSHIVHPRRPSGEQESKDVAVHEAKPCRQRPSPKGRGGDGSWQVVRERSSCQPKSSSFSEGATGGAAMENGQKVKGLTKSAKEARKVRDTPQTRPVQPSATAPIPPPARQTKQKERPHTPLKAELVCVKEPHSQSATTSSLIINAGATPPAGDSVRPVDSASWPSAGAPSLTRTFQDLQEHSGVAPAATRKESSPMAPKETEQSGNRGRARGCLVLEQQQWPLPGEKRDRRSSDAAEARPATTPLPAEVAEVEKQKSWYDLMEEEASEGSDMADCWVEDPHCCPDPSASFVEGPFVLQYGWTVWSSWPGRGTCFVKMGSFGTLDEFRALWHRLPPLEDGCMLQFFRRDISPNAADHPDAPRWLADNLPVEAREPLWCRTVAAVVLGHYLEPEGTEPITALLLTACWDWDRAEFWMSGNAGCGTAATQAAAYRSMANLHSLLFPEDGPAHAADPMYPVAYSDALSSPYDAYTGGKGPHITDPYAPYGAPCLCPACPPLPPFPHAGAMYPTGAPAYVDEAVAHSGWPTPPVQYGAPPPPASASTWHTTESATVETSAVHHAPPVTCYVHNPYAPMPDEPTRMARLP